MLTIKDRLSLLPEWQIYRIYLAKIEANQNRNQDDLNASLSVDLTEVSISNEPLLINALEKIAAIIIDYINAQKSSHSTAALVPPTSERLFSDLYLYSFDINHETRVLGLLRKTHLFINALLGNTLHIPINFTAEEKALLQQANVFIQQYEGEKCSEAIIDYLLFILKYNLKNILQNDYVEINVSTSGPINAANTSIHDEINNLIQSLETLSTNTEEREKADKDAGNKLITCPYSTISEQLMAIFLKKINPISEGITPSTYKITPKKAITISIATIASLLSAEIFADSSRAGLVALIDYVIGQPLRTENLGYDLFITILNYLTTMPSSVIVNAGLGVMVLHAFFFGGLADESWFWFIFDLALGEASMFGIAMNDLLGQEKNITAKVFLLISSLLTGFIHAYGITVFRKFVANLFRKYNEEEANFNARIDILTQKFAYFISQKNVVAKILNLKEKRNFKELYEEIVKSPMAYIDPNSISFVITRGALFIIIALMANVGIYPYLGVARLGLLNDLNTPAAGITAAVLTSPINVLLTKGAYTGSNHLTQRLLASQSTKHIAQMAVPRFARVIDLFMFMAAIFSIASLAAAAQTTWRPFLQDSLLWQIMLILGLQYCTSLASTIVFNYILQQDEIQNGVAFSAAHLGSAETRQTIQTVWALEELNGNIAQLTPLERIQVFNDPNPHGLNPLLQKMEKEVETQKQRSASTPGCWNTCFNHFRTGEQKPLLAATESGVEMMPGLPIN